MESKKRDMNFRCYYLHDKFFKNLVEEFLEGKSITKRNLYVEALNIFYFQLKNEPSVFSLKDSTLKINRVSLVHILNIQNYIESLGRRRTVKSIKIKDLLIYLYDFCEFLTKRNITKIYYTIPNKLQDPHLKKENRHSITVKFKNYMVMRNYAAPTCQNYARYVEMFLRMINYNDDLHFNSEFWLAGITKFQETISKRILTEEISSGSGYEYLKAVKLFVKFLNEGHIIDYHYKIPKRLISNGNRTNEHVKNEDILLVIEKIFESSPHVLRDLLILMILIEVGCRPIEIENLNMDDVHLNERLIVLKSKKSFQRTLKLSDTTVSLMKSYLLLRKNYFPKENTQAFFLKTNGIRMASGSITQLIRKYNMKTFKENRFTAKTLRHRFITNAFNEGNDVEQVRQSVGHRHLISTHYYFYRDINKLKNLFIGKSLIRSDYDD